MTVEAAAGTADGHDQVTDRTTARARVLAVLFPGGKRPHPRAQAQGQSGVMAVEQRPLTRPWQRSPRLRCGIPTCGGGAMLRSAYSRLPDGALAQRARGGDADAARGICERHRTAMLAFARGYTRSRDDAEDVVQQVLGVELPSVLQTWRGHCALRTLLLTVVRRRCIDCERSQQARSRNPALLPQDPPADPASQTVHRVRMKECLERLTVRERLVLLTRHDQGLGYAETAQVLHLRLGTVASLLARARTRLQRCLDE